MKQEFIYTSDQRAALQKLLLCVYVATLQYLSE